MSGTVPVVVPPCPVTPPVNPYVTVEQFRLDRPPFADDTVYPDATVQYWLDIAGVMVNPAIWCQLTTMGMELVAAHFLTLQQAAMTAGGGGAGGAAGGMASGLMSSKSVSKVSVSYDNASVAIEGGGPWNYTIYGRQYLQWAMMAGTGGYETLARANAEIGLVHAWAHTTMLGLGRM